MEIKKIININTISLFVTLISAILAIYFYLESKKESGLSYTYQSQPSLIFNKENALGLKLYEKDSVLIDKNVYLLKGSIWNSGDFPITKDDIRKNLLIELEGVDRILDFEITKQIDPDVSKFKLEKMSVNSLGLDWKYFDPNNGFNFQILYIGDNMKGLSVSGKILNIESFSDVQFLDMNKKEGYMSFYFIVLFFISFAVVFFIVYSMLNYNKKHNKELNDKFIHLFIEKTRIFALVFILIISFLTILFYIIISPFLIPSYPSELLYAKDSADSNIILFLKSLIN